MKAISSPDEGRQMSALMQSTLTRFSNLPMITAVLVEGRAIGGGAELTTAADFRIMAPNSEVQFVHVRMGITSAWGGMTRLTQIVGPTLALDLFASGRPLRPDEATRTGFASYVLRDEQDTKEQALQWISERIKGPAEIMRAIKLGMVAARNLPLQEALQRENELFASVWGQDAHNDALRQNMKHWCSSLLLLLNSLRVRSFAVGLTKFSVFGNVVHVLELHLRWWSTKVTRLTTPGLRGMGERKLKDFNHMNTAFAFVWL